MSENPRLLELFHKELDAMKEQIELMLYHANRGMSKSRPKEYEQVKQAAQQALTVCHLMGEQLNLITRRVEENGRENQTENN